MSRLLKLCLLIWYIGISKGYDIKFCLNLDEPDNRRLSEVLGVHRNFPCKFVSGILDFIKNNLDTLKYLFIFFCLVIFLLSITYCFLLRRAVERGDPVEFDIFHILYRLKNNPYSTLREVAIHKNESTIVNENGIVDYQTKQIDDNGKTWWVQKDSLGEGSFGNVNRGYDDEKRRIAAIKTFKEKEGDDANNQRNRENFYREIAIWEHIRKMNKSDHCNNIVQFISKGTNTAIFIVIEYMESGSLKSCLKSKNFQPQQTISILTQVANGMRFLSRIGIIHRDLSARNVLLEIPGNKIIAKISDFGCAGFRNNDICVVENLGITTRWMSPEAIKESKFSEKSEVWAFGVLIFEVLSNGKLPYENLNNEDVELKVKNDCNLATILVESLNETQSYFLNRSKEDPTALRVHTALEEIMKESLSSNPDGRPTFDQLFNKLESI